MPDTSFILSVVEYMAYLFIFVVGLALFAIVVIYIIDVSQTKQAIRHNYPVIGRFRYWFEELG
ncbi:MAG: hypothetical protein JKX75_05190, partial [Gammaproteobacteria bacterium]|nr:hypothetical protein [Gammaproteobacteria bacterium]